MDTLAQELCEQYNYGSIQMMIMTMVTMMTIMMTMMTIMMILMFARASERIRPCKKACEPTTGKRRPKLPY